MWLTSTPYTLQFAMQSEILLAPGEDGHNCCSRCKAYRCNLRALVSRHEKHTSDTSCTDPHSHAAFSYLSSPQKCTRYHHVHALQKAYQRQVTNLKKILDTVIDKSGIMVSSSLHDDLVQIMKDNVDVICTNHPPGTFWAKILGSSNASSFSQGFQTDAMGPCYGVVVSICAIFPVQLMRWCEKPEP